MNRNVNRNIVDNVFSDNSETIWAYLKASNTKGSDYDPFRDTGYTKIQQSPEPVKALIRQLTPNSLILRELGLSVTGSIEIVIKEKDMNLVKIAEKIKYDENDYTVYNKAVGNRVQFTKIPFGFYRVVLFRKGD